MYSPQQIKTIFTILRKVANGENGYSEIMELFELNGMNEEDFEKLVSYDYLVPKDKYGKQYFSYRESDIIGALDEYEYVLPKCLYYHIKPETLRFSVY